MEAYSTTSPSGVSAGSAVRAAGINIEAFGAAFSRYGLALVLIWIGLMKFSAYEAMGIAPLVSHSPLMAWMLRLVSIRTISDGLGVIEVATGVLIALRALSPRAAQIGAALAIITFFITLTFLFSTPGAWAAPLGGFPALSGDVGQFLIKDVVLLGVSLWVFGEASNSTRRGSRISI